MSSPEIAEMNNRVLELVTDALSRLKASSDGTVSVSEANEILMSLGFGSHLDFQGLQPSDSVTVENLTLSAVHNVRRNFIKGLLRTSCLEDLLCLHMPQSLIDISAMSIQDIKIILQSEDFLSTFSLDVWNNIRKHEAQAHIVGKDLNSKYCEQGAIQATTRAFTLNTHPPPPLHTHPGGSRRRRRRCPTAGPSTAPSSGSTAGR